MKKQVWSKDEECYQSDTLAELIHDYDLTVGTVVHHGIAVHPSASIFVDADNVIEMAQERAYDEYSDYAECFLDGVTDEEKKKLDDFLSDWLDRNADVTFYMVTDVKAHIITKQDIADSYK